MSKMTNLKKGVVGVCAATMLAGMCAVPAFAAAGDVDVDGNGTTTVKATVDTQLSVTVPTELTASVESDGTLTYANNAALLNKSQLAPVHVSAVSVTDKEGVLVAKTAFDAASGNNQAWTEVTPNGKAASVLDLKGSFVASSDWNIAAATGSTDDDAGKLPVTFAGKMKNPSATGEINIYDIVWTVEFGATA